MSDDYHTIVLAYPVIDWILTQGFGMNPESYSQFGYAGHNGNDYYSDKRSILAAHPGKVTRVGWDETGYGNYVILEAYTVGHFLYKTLYAHMNSVNVNVSDELNVHQQIGVMGYTGNVWPKGVGGTHLHFELQLSQRTHKGYPKGQVDPTPYFGAVQPGNPPDTIVDIPGVEWYTIDAGTDGLRLRGGPATSYPILAVWPTGKEVPVTQFVEDWAELQLYMHKDYLKKGE